MDRQTKRLRVATWNLNGNNRPNSAPALAYLADTLAVDLGLVQEANPSLEKEWSGLAPVVVHQTRKWGTAIAARAISVRPLNEVFSVHNSKAASSMAGPYQGSVAAGIVTVPPLGDIVVVSIYARVDNGYSFMHIHSILNTLIPLLDSSYRKFVLVGGDINNCTQVPAGDRYLPRLQNLMDRFSASGLFDLWDHALKDRGPLEKCPCGAGPSCRHVRTQRHQNKPTSKPWQTDYLWATVALRDRLVTCQPIDADSSWALSDHCPVVAEFDVS